MLYYHHNHTLLRKLCCGMMMQRRFFIKLLLKSVNSCISSQKCTEILVTDALEIATGAVLHYKIDGDLLPLGFFNRAFNTAQLKYSVFEKKLTAIHMAVAHFNISWKAENSTLSLINEISSMPFC